MFWLYVAALPGTPVGSAQSVYVWPSPSSWATVQSEPQHGVPAHVVRFDSHPSSGEPAVGWLQLPHPGWQVELQTPPEHEGVAVSLVLHGREHAPQFEVLPFVFVSQPCDGSPTQWPKPGVQLSVQFELHVPSMGLQHVLEHTTEPGFTVYEQLAPSDAHEPVAG
jgi:hypothetical protein